MTNYAGRYAELYDLFYGDKPYAEEARFIHDCIQKFSAHPTREILELACGTGRHALELEKFAYHITATDRSPDMLEVARRRAAETGSKVIFALADMGNLQLPAKEYDAAVCLFDSIGYLQTDNAILDALGEIRSHLRSGGLFIFEFWHAPAMLNQYSRTRVRKVKTEHGVIVRTSETSLDRENGLASVTYTVDEQDKNRTHSTFRETHINRFFSVDEIESLVSSAELEPLKFFAGFDQQASITDDTWHVVALTGKS